MGDTDASSFSKTGCFMVLITCEALAAPFQFKVPAHRVSFFLTSRKFAAESLQLTVKILFSRLEVRALNLTGVVWAL